jgi:hypothetical protein
LEVERVLTAIITVRTRDEDGIGVVPIEARVARTKTIMYCPALRVIPWLAAR